MTDKKEVAIDLIVKGLRMLFESPEQPCAVATKSDQDNMPIQHISYNDPNWSPPTPKRTLKELIDQEDDRPSLYVQKRYSKYGQKYPMSMD